MIGEIVAGRYRIVSRQGAGGAGDVFEAEDLELPRRIAIKFLSEAWADERRLRQRFLREAEALSALDHPHICTIYEAGETESGRMFIAMAFYEGEDLRTRLAHGALDLVEAVSWSIAIADGMDKAHRKGILHRDLKPGNIIITEDGVVKILDFGLAKLPDRTQVTETGTTMGTLAYAAPEQAGGETVDARSDIYALGVMLYQMVTGVCPFAASGPAATLQMVLHAKVKPASELRDDLPEELTDLIHRCMDRDPAQRPASMDEVRQGLLDVLASISPSEAAHQRALHVDTTRPIRVPSGRSLRPWLVVALVMAALALSLQTEAVQRWLGLGAPPVNRGAIVIPFRPEGGDATLEEIALGAWVEFNDQAMRLADLHREQWVVPASVADGAEPEDADDVFGVETVIEGVLGPADRGFSLAVTATGPEGRLTRANWTIPGDGSVAPDLLAFLSDALGLSLGEDERRRIRHGSPTDPGVYEDYLIGLGALQSGSAQRALERLSSVATAAPEFAIARMRQAEAMITLGGEAGAKFWLDRADSLLAAEPRPIVFPATTYALLGKVAEARDDYAGAARMTRLALEHRPLNPDFRRTLWLDWYYSNELASAEAVTAEGLELNPGYFGAWEDRAFVAYIKADFDAAIAYLEKCIELAPDNAYALNTLGVCHLKLEQWPEATDAFERSFGIDASDDAASNLGSLYYLQGDYQQAAEMYDFALQYEPENYVLIGNKSSALRQIPGREQDADALDARAAEIAEAELAADPDDLKIRSDLASYYATLDPERAVALAEEVLARTPEDPEILFRIAVVFEESGHRERALSVLESAIKHGMTMGQIANEPLLDELREDSRYRLLLP